MKFTAKQEDLAERIALASRAASPAGGLFALSGVHVAAEDGTVVFTGSDLDQTVRARISADVESPGAAVVPARLLADIIRVMPSGVTTVTEGEGEIGITAGRTNFSVRLMDAEQYPKLNDETGDGVELPAAELAAAFQRVAKAAGTDDTRPLLTGVRFEPTEDGLRLVATDSYRLALNEVAGVQMLGTDQSIIVPARSLADVARLMRGHDHVVVQMGERHIAFSVESDERWTRLSCRLIEGDFPAYAPLIAGKDNFRMSVSISELAETTRRLDMIAKDGSAQVRITAHSDRADMTAISQDIGSGAESVDADFDGEDGLEVSYNPKFLLDGLDSFSGDTVEIWDIDPLKPSLLKSEGTPGFLYLIMPVRV